MNYKLFSVTERLCAVCQGKYFLGPLSFDGGTCKKCAPGFLSTPLSLRGNPAGTLALWKLQIFIHLFFVFFFGMLLDADSNGDAGAIYCLTIVSYFTVKIWNGKQSEGGFPVLTRIQRFLLVTLFIWGGLEFGFIFTVTQSLKAKF
ncbi:MAG: hypothetical protein JWM68_5781 [Verrucomicrobiales bacterium]|nr:hypothetical protein [Verrucomicrobiales bacterium]